MTVMTSEEVVAYNEYESRIGRVSIRALEEGGEPLLDRAIARLGVATRHLERIRQGQLSLTPAVVGEINSSFDRAEELLRANGQA